MPPDLLCHPVPETVRSRLHFARTFGSGVLVTPPLAAGLLLQNLAAPTAPTFKRWMRRWARTILGAASIRVDVEDRSALPPDRPAVLVANHQNMLDIVVCSAAVRHPHGFAAKAELRHTPVVGTVLGRSSCVFVDRSTARRAAESVVEAAALIRGGNSVLIYPEGERSYGPALRPFLRGAFLLAAEAGVPIVPVVQLNNFALFDERRRVSRAGRARVLVLEPIETAGVGRAGVPELMRAVREQMEEALAPVLSANAAVSSAATDRPTH